MSLSTTRVLRTVSVVVVRGGQAVVAQYPSDHDERPGVGYLPRVPQRPSAAGNAPVSRGPYVSAQANVNALGGNIIGDAANEPSLAIDPTNPDVVVIGWRQFDNIASSFRQAGYAYSHDHGQSWTFPTVLEPGVFRSDPVLDSDADGNIFYYSLRGDFECFTFVSDDGGVSWSGPFEAFGGDKAWCVADRTSSPGQGHIYAAWSTAGNNYFPNQFARSVETGLSWEDPLEMVQDGLRPIWGTLAVDSEGDLYVAGTRSGLIYIMKSPSAKFERQIPGFDPRVEVDMAGTFTTGDDPNPNPAGLLGQVWVATDRSGGPTEGNVYLLTSIDPDGVDQLDVHFARSEDGGLTWSAPIRVNDDPPHPDAWQWFGTMSVAPTGRIDAIWADTRADLDEQLSELHYAYSTDAGETWSPNLAVSPQFNSHVGWPQQNKLGDYYDMISDEATARIAYSATFNGEQDVYYLEVGDCNGNGVHDSLDIGSGDSTDFNGNTIPDDCECLADLDQNGEVDVVDLVAIVTAWGVCDGCPEDFNGDGEVDVLDLLVVILSWGEC